MRISKPGATIGAMFLGAAVCAATLFAQVSQPPAGSLGELTAEIRQLRLAIEQSSRTQMQAQALGIFLSAQQSRILQVTTRLDAARKELDAAAQRALDDANRLARLEEQIPQVSDQNERTAIEDQSRHLKVAIKTIAAQEQQARAREAEMLQAWQQEEARWNDLIARLQQIVER
jgi:chromosome segregation ATPase